MKQILFTILSLMLMGGGRTLNSTSSESIIAASCDDPSSPSKKELIIQKSQKPKSQRDVYSEVRAFYDGSSKTLDIELYEVGPSVIYLLNSKGQIVGTEESGSNEFDIVSLPVPEQPGTYNVHPYSFGDKFTCTILPYKI